MAPLTLASTSPRTGRKPADLVEPTREDIGRCVVLADGSDIGFIVGLSVPFVFVQFPLGLEACRRRDLRWAADDYGCDSRRRA